MPKIGVGAHLRKLREERGLSQPHAAQALGISKNRISLIENNNLDLKSSELGRFAAYYGVSPAVFFEKSPELSPKHRRAMWIFKHDLTDLQRNLVVATIKQLLEDELLPGKAYQKDRLADISKKK